MLDTPLHKPKFLMPELPDRALLTDRIKNLPISGKRAAIIVAPGGFGKTTAILLSLRKERQNIRWYRLEKEDAFLPVFYTNLIDTLFSGVDKAGLDCCKGLNGVSSITEEYALINALLCQDAWAHFPSDGAYHYLVLDDYQNIADSNAIAETIRYLIANMPDRFGVIVASRVEPNIYTGKLMLYEEVSYISEDDLRFTREETGTLLRENYNLKASKRELDAIFGYTEGWIAGLYLVSRANAIPDEPAWQARIDEQQVFNYFFNSFLKKMDARMLETLASMSIFNEFSREELEQVLEVEDAGALLEWLESNNMYIQKFLAQPVKYRFHSLFRHELSLYLKQIKSNAEINQLYMRAACYYEKDDDVGNAIRLYLEAGSTDSAVNVIKTAGSRFFAKGQVEEIMYYTNAFSDNVVRSEPYLLFFRGCMLLTTNIEEAYECFKTALLMFRRKGDMPYLMNTFGMILVMSYQTNDFKYVNETVKFVPMLRITLSKNVARKKMFMTAFFSIVAGEKLKLGMLLQRLLKRVKLPEPIWEYSFLVVRGMLLYRVGRLDAAKESFYRVMRHPVCQSSDQWRIIGMVGVHNSLWLSGDFKAARKVMDEFAELGEKYDSAHCRSFAYRLSAFANFRENNIPGSIEDGQKNVEMQKLYGSPLMASAALIARYVKECLLNPSPAWAEKAEAEFRHITKENAGHGYYELSRARLGVIYKYIGDLNRAEELLLEAYHVNKNKGANQYTAMVAAHLADLYYLRGDAEKLRKYLRMWLRLSEKYDFVFFYLIDHATLARCCALAVQKGVRPACAAKILRYYMGEAPAQMLANDSQSVMERPQEFVDNWTRPKQSAADIFVTMLGEFTVTQNGVTIKESDWKTRKISGILKYLLAHRGRHVAREALAAVFWPESGTKAAAASLRVALSELRKCLAAHGMSFGEKDSIVTEEKGGFCVYAKTSQHTDVERFETLYRRIERGEIVDAEQEEALAHLLELYRGDFLADSPYDDWTFLLREHYRSLFMESSHALLRIYMKKGAYRDAEELIMKHMQIDPLDEKACGAFVDICRLSGQDERANAFARMFEKRFFEEMGVMPQIGGSI